MASGIEREIYIRLLEEGTDVFRPTKGVDLGGGVFIIQSAEGQYLRAVKLQN
jgi:hypothetical protein